MEVQEIQEMTVAGYIASAPKEQRAALRELRSLIKKAAPGAVEAIADDGYVGYRTEDGRWVAGFAHRAKCPMLYVMAGKGMAKNAGKLGPLRSGKSCIEWRELKGKPSLTYAELKEMAKEMVSEAAAVQGVA